MWAKADEPSEYLIGLYRQAWAHSDDSLDTLSFDAPARVVWWPDERVDTTFGSLVVRVVAETAHHAGHCDIVRELIDGQTSSGTPRSATQSSGWPTWRRSRTRLTHSGVTAESIGSAFSM